MQSKLATVGVDIGGTFTDVVVFAEGVIRTSKLLSTPEDYSEAVLQGISRMGGEMGAEKFEEFVHATTVATNAVLERRGALTALITTQGFRDVLEIGRLRHPILYDLRWEKPAPLVPRDLRVEVPERISASGTVQVPIDLDRLADLAHSLVQHGVTSIAITFVNSYANIVHEEAAKRRLKADFPDLQVSASVDVIREIREFERTSTTVLDAYVKPVVSRYLDRILGGIPPGRPLYVMQSNGGMVDADVARDHPVRILESGPAAGVMAAVALAGQRGDMRVLTFDMGGTTAKAGVIEDGVVGRANEFEVGSDISGQARVMTGSGYLIRLPVVDIAEVGAGGGSLAWLDSGGAIRVGPESAGSSPGPACYGRGGLKPTVTDANVALGYIDVAGFPTGSGLSPSADAARSVIEREVAAPSGLSLDRAAVAVHQVCNATMMRAIRSVSTERGRDAREYTLYAFGGSGPVHAASLAALLGVTRIVIPPIPSTLSALGLLLAGVEQDFVQSVPCLLEPESLPPLIRAYEGLQDQANHSSSDSWRGFERTIDLRYHGQQWELTLPVGTDTLDPDGLARLSTAFHHEHQATFGHSDDSRGIEVVNVRLKARGRDSSVRLDDLRYEKRDVSTRTGERQVYDIASEQWAPVPVVQREMLDRLWREGPLLVEEDGTVTLVPRGWKARSDDFHCIEMLRIAEEDEVFHD